MPVSRRMLHLLVLAVFAKPIMCAFSWLVMCEPEGAQASWTHLWRWGRCCARG